MRRNWGGFFHRELGQWLFVAPICMMSFFISHNLPSWLKFRSLPELASNTGLLFLFFLLTASGIATIASSITWTLDRLLSKLTPLFIYLSSVVAIIIASGFFLRVLFFQITDLFSIDYLSPSLRRGGWLALCVFIVISSIASKNGRDRFNNFVERLNVFIPICGAFSLLSIVAVVIHPPEWQPYREKILSQSLSRKGPNVILFTFDTLSAKHLSFYGYNRDTSPNLSALAEKSYVFDRFMATSTYTAPTVPAILTGLYPIHHRSFFFWPLSPSLKNKNVFSAFKKEGYAIGATVGNPQIHPSCLQIGDILDFNSPYYEGGLRIFDLPIQLSLCREVRSLLQDLGLLELTYKFHETHDTYLYAASFNYVQAKDFIKQVQGPYFLWIHICPPHAPYMPHHPFRGRFSKITDEQYLSDLFLQNGKLHGKVSESAQPDLDRLRDRYDEFILETDQEFGQFMEWLKKEGQWSNLLLAISSDHGENFTTDWVEHEGGTMYESLIHIPFLLKLPGQEEGRRISTLADQTDILPTLADLAGIDLQFTVDGLSLSDSLQEDAPSFRERVRYSMFLDGNERSAPINKGVFVARRGDMKLIWDVASDEAKLVDAGKDPYGKINKLHEQPALASELKTSIKNYFHSELAPFLQ